MGPDEPECPERPDVLDTLLKEPELDGCFQDISPRKAEKKELERVHSEDYIQRLAATSGRGPVYLDEDTPYIAPIQRSGLTGSRGIGPGDRSSPCRSGGQRLRPGPPSGSPCRTDRGQRILPLQQCSYRLGVQTGLGLGERRF